MVLRFHFDWKYISGNAQQGLFIAGNYDSGNIGPNKRFVISSNTISNNGSQGLYLQSSQYFTVSNNTICNNSGNGINIACDNATYGLCSYNNFNGNVSSANTGGSAVGFYNDASNSYTAGARSNHLSLNIMKLNTAGQVVGDLTAYTIDDDTILNTNQVTLHSTSSGNYANIYPSNTGSTNFTFPGGSAIQNDVLTTDYLGNTSWTSTPSVAYVTLNDGISGHHVNIRPPTTGNSDFIFPATNGTANQILQTDGATNSSWTSAPTLSALTVTGNDTVSKSKPGIKSTESA